jgi:homoserine kinase type II
MSAEMALITPLALEDARRIGRAFGLDVARVAPVQGGSVNSNFRLETQAGRSVFVRVYEEQATAGANQELAVLAALARAGVPTPMPLARGDGSVLDEHRGKPVALFPWVDGEILCQARVRVEHTRAVGQALARVHLARIDDAPKGRFERADLEARLSRAAKEAPRFEPVTRQISERLAAVIARRDATLPAGLVHGDLFRDNVLWHDGRIAALIDFESACHGVYVYDLMVCVHAWCFGDRFDPELVRALLVGYHALRRLSPSEVAALPLEGALGALRFATTRITDYSLRATAGAPPLRDYRRFLARLAEIEAGALDSVCRGLD